MPQGSISERIPPLSEHKSVAAEPVEETVKRKREHQSQKPKRQPRYNVILWDDDDHSYGYVIQMMGELFTHSVEKGFQIAETVDTAGRAICLTTTMEHAELKRDQIRGFGTDFYATIPVKYPLGVRIEPMAGGD